MTKEFEFLYKLQASGKTNMLGAAPYLARQFKVNELIAIDVVTEWMDKWDQAEYDEANKK